MSDETSQAPENLQESAPAKSAPKVRRISNPRPKKKAPAASADAPVSEVAAANEAPVAESGAATEWPEPETISDSSSEGGDAKRNKRRRRKGKGNKGNGPRDISDAPVGGEDSPPLPVMVEAGESETPVVAASEQQAPQQPAQAPRPPQQHQQRPQQLHQQPRPQQDPQVLAKKAWKIYLAEISEEGVSLISDQDARELSRRCFRLAEIFLDEQGRKTR